MSGSQDVSYQFSDRLPINPIEPGSTVMVAGPKFSPAEDLALSMVADAATHEEGMLFLSTNMTVERLLSACQQSQPGLEPSHVGVVDCTGQDIGDADSEAEVMYVSTQSDLTGMGMKFSSLYESLYQNHPDGRVRIGLVSLSSLVMYADLRDVFRFAQTISARIESAGGLGVFTIDPSMHDTQIVNTLKQVADGLVQVRDADADTSKTADGELQIKGFRNQSPDWQPFSL
ncbi:hypothetical protein SAMN04488065_0314 [Haloplanus vescus]|uniref:RecA-superfamily ATPase, KaiC/GvpD/RAD55 family n=1 Tax=Haloplanus vescus TaxID=555874 RepID=A0A1H3VVR1_9EURY|nr:hypothetical protein [Haloplanus vescus]SDZ78781.1 hypothetical protein SAMN04488065_0314 [Haloplanus vescus]